ncbi:MAG: nucleotide pyrophosphatase, partial [Bacteroidetes bacterium]
NATREAGTYDNTVFIVASDHGGIGTSHGGDSPEELTIFVGLSGPGVREGIQVTDPVYVVDVAATAAFFLGLETPRAWYGKPIYCAINGFECEKQIN